MGFNSNYNIYCSSSAQNCISGCCTAEGSCATSLSNCLYRYYDFTTNPTYTLSVYTNPYPCSNSNYYICDLSTKSTLDTIIGIYVGSYVGYILLFVIGAIICYCLRKKWVAGTEAYNTENKNLENAGNQVISMATNNQIVGMRQGMRNNAINPMNNTFHRINNQSYSLNHTSIQKINQHNIQPIPTNKTYPPLEIPQTVQ